MTKLLNVAIVLLTIALIAVILVPQMRENRPRVVRFACDSTVAALPFLVGVDRGFFEEQRIIPELQFYSDPDEALAGLFAGEFDVGIFPWTSVIRRIAEHGDTLRVYVSQDFRAAIPVDAIVVPRASQVNEIADLRNTRLGYPPQLRGAIESFLFQTELSAETVTAIEMPLSELTGALAAGELDAAWLIEPHINMLDTVAFRAMKLGALHQFVSAPFPGAAIGFSPEFMQVGKALLSRLKLSTDAAIAFADGKTDSARMVFADNLGYDIELISNFRLPDVHRLVEINRPSIRSLAMRLSVAGVIADEVDTDGMFVPPAMMTR